MNGLVQKFAGVVKGVLSGFDRIVFKGSLLPLMYDTSCSAMSSWVTGRVLFFATGKLL